MRASVIVLAVLAVIGAILGMGYVGSYNGIQIRDEATVSAWSEVVNQYQRRADLIPNLVNTAKGAAQQEKDVFVGVAEARSRVSSINVQAGAVPDPATLQKFSEAQGQLTQALGRLIAVSEAYPQLKTDQIFKDLMRQLEGTENRITVARGNFIRQVQDFNVGIRRFPGNIVAGIHGYVVKPNFTVADERAVSTAPKVDFNAPTPAPAPAK